MIRRQRSDVTSKLPAQSGIEPGPGGLPLPLHRCNGELEDAAAINEQGDIAGQYTSADGRIHGYLLRRDGFTSLDVPGAARTGVSGINPRGDVVGSFVGSDGRTHGFLWTAAGMTRLDVPGAVFTQPNAINAEGDIVGFYRNAGSTVAHGFVLTAGSFTAVDLPGLVQLRGITPSGVIVGSYSLSGVIHGFVLAR